MPTETINTHIAGVSHRDIDSQIAARNLEAGAPLTLVREPTNSYDRYAVLVYYTDDNEDEYKLGYVPAKHSQRVSTAMLDSSLVVTADAQGEGSKRLNIHIQSMFETDEDAEAEAPADA